MTSITEENKEIAIKFFEALSSGSEAYLNFYNDDSIIWTAGDNAFGGTRTKKEIIDALNAMLISLPQENLILLENLEKNYRLFLLSNANEIHIQFMNEYLQKKLNIPSINQYFEKTYYSQEIGMRKPHKSTFEWVLKDANILAEETLFIEDTDQHIKGAKKVGLKTHHIESNSDIISLFPGITL